MIYVVASSEAGRVHMMTEDINVRNLMLSSVRENGMEVDSFKVDCGFDDAKWTIGEMKKYRLPEWTKPIALEDLFYRACYTVTSKGLVKQFRHVWVKDEHESGNLSIRIDYNEEEINLRMVIPIASSEYRELGRDLKKLNETVKFCANLGYATGELAEAVMVVVEGKYGNAVELDDNTHGAIMVRLMKK